MNIAVSSTMTTIFDPSSFVCPGDRWMAKEGRNTIHRLKLREFYEARRANLCRGKNQEGKMFCFDLYRLPFLQSPSHQLHPIIPL